MKLILEVNENKADYALEFFKNISFVKKATKYNSKEITNPLILKTIESYEKGKEKAIPISLTKLKKLLHA